MHILADYLFIMLDLIQYWYKWWRHIVIFCGVAVLLSIIVSHPAIMKPYYKSQVVFYPANPSINDRTAFFSERSSMIDNFGSKEDINRFLAIANSEELVSFMVDKFKLRNHYDIRKEGYYEVNREFRSNYKAIRNDLGAVELQILDTDPELAAQMVNTALLYIENAYRKILEGNKRTTYELLTNEAEWKGRELRQLADSLNVLKNSSAYFYDKDGNLNGDENLRMLDREFQNLNSFISTLYSISSQYSVTMSDKYPTVYVVEGATVAEKKTKPIRWLIVVSTALSSFVAATLLVILLELLKYADIPRKNTE